MTKATFNAARIWRDLKGRSALLLVVGFASLAVALQVGGKDRPIDTKQGQIKVETVAQGLDQPWGFAFLPDGRMLVTEKRGRLRIVAKDGVISEPIEGVPEVIVHGQGGLLDVAHDPAFDVRPVR